MINQPEPNAPLLCPLETAVVPATIEPFNIRDNIKRAAGIKLSTVWGPFKERYFGKIEDSMPEVTYRKYKLQRIAPDGPIITALGGETKVEGTMSAVFALLQRQGNGGDGFLQTNGYANVFYSRDKHSELCAIRIGWTSEGWVIDAISVQDPLAWNGQHHIFCPLSTDKDPQSP